MRITVALPREAADDGELIAALVRARMDAARINTAHDDIHAWRAMAGHVRAAEKQLDRHCVVCADLAGSKVRTLEVHLRQDARLHKGDRIVLDR